MRSISSLIVGTPTGGESHFRVVDKLRDSDEVMNKTRPPETVVDFPRCRDDQGAAKTPCLLVARGSRVRYRYVHYRVHENFSFHIGTRVLTVAIGVCRRQNAGMVNGRGRTSYESRIAPRACPGWSSEW